MNALQILLSLIPSIIAFIHAAEAAFPGKGTGEKKFSAVADAVGSLVEAIPDAARHAEELKASLKPTVDSLVSTFNSLGVFHSDDNRG